MRCIRPLLIGLLSMPLVMLLIFPAGALAQSGSRVAFSVSPTVLPVGSLAHAVLSAFSVSGSPLTISTGDTFSFFLDPSISIKTLIAALPSVSSASLSAADFTAAAQSASQVVLTYNGQPKTFSYGDTISVEVVMATGGQVGTGKVSFSSRFTGSVNGNLPYTTVSLVDFSTADKPGISHDETLVGGFGSNPLGVAIPLNLSGSVPTGVLVVTNSSPNGDGAIVAQASAGGLGLVAQGGGASGAGNQGGDGISAAPGLGTNGAANGRAGTFEGDVHVGGNLSKAGGSFKIDHPLDPANKYLYHSFVESPDMMNIYNGNAKLDSRGEAVVELPERFGALNKDFRYALSAIGTPGPSLYIAEEVANNRFKIAGGGPGAKVSWTVTGVRQDAWANAHRIPVEEDKSDQERGHYLHPELFNQPEEKSVEWARHPELMRQMKEKREQVK
jgi:hypothetical protein